MKTVKDFLNEASLRGNPATPEDYLQGIRGRAERDIRSTEQRLGPEMGRFRSFIQEVHSMQTPEVKAGLEKLAEKIIMQQYGSILGQTKLDIRFPKDGQNQEIQDMMQEVEMDTPPEMKELKDKETVDQIHRRKIANAIMQGEAKNVKKMLALLETKTGLTKILGSEEKADRMLDLLNKITDIANALDWRIPDQVKRQMWEEDKSGFSGSVSVDFKPIEISDEEKQKLLDAVESGEMDNEEAAGILDAAEPSITALGTDFTMLLHEAVKGIYKLIGSVTIPEDEEAAKKVVSNTGTMSDEHEDIKYGPYLAADLRDFVDKLTEGVEIENIQQRVFGQLLAIEPVGDFLELMRKIFTKDPEAEPEVKSIIDEIIRVDNEWKRSQFDEEIPQWASQEEQEPEEIDMSTLDQREIQDLLDAALDAGDYEEARRISAYLKA